MDSGALSNDGDSFLYFGFASNLLRARIHIGTPTAKLVVPAKLEGYRLCFQVYPGWSVEESLWNGAPASIIESPEGHVWGAVWRLQKSDLANLDPPESSYKAFDVTVTSPEGMEYVCRTYQMMNGQEEELPSPYYMKVITEGAVESGLPETYVEFLRSIKHNGQTNPPDIMNKIFK
ncbi:gamma-glutamylcyclotransferase-like [Lytechinus variegatus]|uniref:gamma-glutamylcyclotransferase-like n=1 Tax=Lytechinus variegatus TaxID=7654 RepID=UPI001BB138FC|nr:gamma-glutamylcyclotransferase-like [Lytechinus variegatus]